jgi:hypothetical protein
VLSGGQGVGVSAALVRVHGGVGQLEHMLVSVPRRLGQCVTGWIGAAAAVELGAHNDRGSAGRVCSTPFGAVAVCTSKTGLATPWVRYSVVAASTRSASRSGTSAAVAGGCRALRAVGQPGHGRSASWPVK